MIDREGSPDDPVAELKDEFSERRRAFLHGRQGSADRFGAPLADWSVLVDHVRAGDPDGLDQLYRLFARGIRFHLCRQLGALELDDRVHDTFLVIVEAIQTGDLREPERLTGFVRTIVRRQIAAYIASNVNRRKEEIDIDHGVRLSDIRSNPEESVMSDESVELVRIVLDRMNDRDREILTRFYLFEQSMEQICDDMGLSETQFRLLKSRAKARFGELGKKKLQHQALATCLVRTSAMISH